MWEGRRLMAVRLTPCWRNESNAPHKVPGSSFFNVNMTEVIYGNFSLSSSSARLLKTRNRVVFLLLSSMFWFSTGNLYIREQSCDEIHAEVFVLSSATNSAALDVLEVSILEYVRGNSLRNCPTCPHTCGWEYIVSMSFSEPAFDKRQWCMAANCSPTILNSGSESRNQSRSKSRVYTTRPLVEFSNGTTAYSTSSLLTASKQLLIDSFGMDSTSDLNCWASAFVSWKRQNQKMNVPDEYMCLEGPNRLLWPLKS